MLIPASHTSPSPMSPTTFRALGATAGTLGAAAAAVSAWLFVAGLTAMERDAGARAALIASGVLMTACQIGAAGIAGLVPQRALRRTRAAQLVLGAVLLAFEIVTMTTSQIAITRGATATANAAGARIAELRAAIESRRATAAGLRASAAGQADSRILQARLDGSAALRDAAAIEAGIEPIAAELARLDAEQRPTIEALLGRDATVWWTAVRSALIAVMGLVMTGAAGSLLRAAREMGGNAGQPLYERPVVQAPEAAPHPAPLPAAASAPAVASAIAPAPAPIDMPDAGPVEPSAAVPEPEPLDGLLADVPVLDIAPTDEPAGRPDTGVGEGSNERYQRIRRVVRAGDLAPTVRAIRDASGASTETAQRYLKQLADEGVICARAKGRGWELAG